MNYNEVAKNILIYVGGGSNVKELVHCSTRLRFTLVDFGKVRKEELQQQEGVITVVESMGQCQVVIGNKVAKVYDELISILGGQIHRVEKSKSLHEKGSRFNRVLSTLSAIFTPTIPALAGSGMLKGLLAITAMFCLKVYGTDIKTMDTYVIINAASDAVFYFLPIILAYTSAKVFKTNELIAMVLGGTLCYPGIVALMTGEGMVTLFGLPVTKASYTSSVIPIIIAVWVLSYVRRFLDKYIPEVISIIMVPTFSLLIMVPATLLVFGPIGIYIGNGVNWFYYLLMNFSPILCGAFIGGMWCVLVVFGAHRAILPVGINDLANTGRQNLLAFAGSANFSQAGAAMGVFFKTKNTKLKTVSMSASITALFGITEPAIYGANLRLKRPMICAVICGAIGGGVMGFGGAYGTAFANQGLLTIPVYAEAGVKGFLSYVMGCSIAFFGSAILTYIVGFQDIQEESERIKIEGSSSIMSPVTGRTIPLSEVKDVVFSSGALGEGVAVIPEKGELLAPVKCTVTLLYPTLHAIGLTLENGVELLIHVGIDTVNLNGKFFKKYVEEGSMIEKGARIISFDLEQLQELGYDTIIPIIITDTKGKGSIHISGFGQVDNSKTIITIAD